MRDLSTTFATNVGPVTAVDGVSLVVRPGESLGIVGESGSGKSVLVRSIMNLLPRSAEVAGNVIFDDVPMARRGKKEMRHFWGPEMAMVFQNPMTSLNPVKKIGQQIIDPIRFHLGKSRSAARRDAADLLDRVGIVDVQRCLDQYPHQLSGGMRQRVSIAIALSCSPKLLIADEPTTALDVTVQKQILDLLQRLQQESGMAMILISHDLAVVAGRANRLGVMYAGRLVEAGPASEVFADPRHRYTGALLASAPDIALDSHTRLATINGTPPNLLALEPGCRFAPRCAVTDPTCEKEEPMFHFDNQRLRGFACHHPIEPVPSVNAGGQ
ncbi:ABC transporter ATP-binding protein [Nocardioides sp. Bht2]|uniref:ABC transporter ATP-binding protein n=1 Tax=Nocardioides sp. Bht2 TaxID=3392297 RepID=UPI0039B5825A